MKSLKFQFFCKEKDDVILLTDYLNCYVDY